MAKIIKWETEKDYILAKCIALSTVLTGESPIPDERCLSVIQYSVYFLQEMGLNFGNYKYNFIPENKRGIESAGLRENLLKFGSPELIDEAREYILHESTNGTTEKTGRLLLESKSCIGTGYSQTEYLGTMANAYFLRKMKDEEEVLYILRHDTSFTNIEGNARALHSARSLMRR